MTYTFFTPTDLREVDPRPAPSLDAEEATVRRMLEARFIGDELTRALQALGLEPYERSVNPNARDAWMRITKPTRHSERDARRQIACPKGHPRATHSAEDRRGRPYCLTCRAELTARRREEARLRKAAA
jgi:hypothetical protein